MGVRCYIACKLNPNTLLRGLRGVTCSHMYTLLSTSTPRIYEQLGGPAIQSGSVAVKKLRINDAGSQRFRGEKGTDYSTCAWFTRLTRLISMDSQIVPRQPSETLCIGEKNKCHQP